MRRISLPEKENIYETRCPILYAMDVFGQKWKLPILWYIAEGEVLRYKELQRKVVGITPTMLTKSLRELETDRLVRRKQYDTIPPTVEYSLTERGKSLIPALESLYQWAEKEMERKTKGAEENSSAPFCFFTENHNRPYGKPGQSGTAARWCG